MKRPLRPEEARLWSAVAATVRPAFRRAPLPSPPPPPQMAATAPVVGKRAKAPSPPSPPPAPSRGDPQVIEPRRHQRLVRERDPLARRLDLHGLDQDRARAVLHAFLADAQADGARAVLVITGKGVQGDGVLRRRVPDWLAEPPSRSRVAGVSQAHRRHGGEGALYVALKRLAR